MEVYKLLLILLYVIWTVISIKTFIDIRFKSKPISQSNLLAFWGMLTWMFIHCGAVLFGLTWLLDNYVSFEWLFYKIELWK